VEAKVLEEGFIVETEAFSEWNFTTETEAFG